MNERRKSASGNKNAYEIRLELLHLAQSVLNNKRLSDYMEKIHFNFDTCGMPQTPPNPPSSEEIIAEAEKLSDFITHGGRKPEDR